MRSTRQHVTLVISLSIVAVMIFGASPCFAQARVTSLDELRREVAAGDFIIVVPEAGPPVAGRLMRLGDVDLEVRRLNTRTPRGGLRDVTIPLNAIQSLERPRDSVRNGITTGAGIGAGVGGALFVYALIIDRNELDEWGPIYAGVTAVFTGIGALAGWATDAAMSKPHIKFDVRSMGKTKVSVQPMYARGRGIALAVSLSR